jgi:ubiquinol-cytochrome c reductase iron-sulfur subunit
MPDPTRPKRRGGETLPSLLFGAAIVAMLGFIVAYFLRADTQVLGAFLAVGLGAIGAGMIVWAKRFMTPSHPEVEPRGRLASTAEEIEAFQGDFEVGEFEMERRGLLTKLLVAAVGTAGLAAIVPLRSLGPRPGRDFTASKWQNNRYVVDESDKRVRFDRVNTDAILTVFPEHSVGDELAQTLLIGLRPNQFQAPPGRETWVPNNIAGFSKVCTHAGCPVGLYQANKGELICPCHQSTFDVYTAAEPVFGPAATPLPQLPLAIDQDGYLYATGDFSSPPGPGFWDQDRGT